MSLHDSHSISGAAADVADHTEPLPALGDPATKATASPEPVRPADKTSVATPRPVLAQPVVSDDGNTGTLPIVHVDGHRFHDISSERVFQPATPAPRQVERELAPIDRAKWVAPLPRCCGTCRDFRRHPDGRTGYCSNVYAFSQPTMVECDQLACRSSTGVWWLPSDDVWLERVEISHHTRPTPYLEAALGQASRRL